MRSARYPRVAVRYKDVLTCLRVDSSNSSGLYKFQASFTIIQDGNRVSTCRIGIKPPIATIGNGFKGEMSSVSLLGKVSLTPPAVRLFNVHLDIGDGTKHYLAAGGAVTSTASSALSLYTQYDSLYDGAGGIFGANPGYAQLLAAGAGGGVTTQWKVPNNSTLILTNSAFTNSMTVFCLYVGAYAALIDAPLNGCLAAVLRVEYLGQATSTTSTAFSMTSTTTMASKSTTMACITTIASNSTTEAVGSSKCAPQATGIAHQSSPDTAKAFQDDPYYSQLALGVTSPPGFREGV